MHDVQSTFAEFEFETEPEFGAYESENNNNYSFEFTNEQALDEAQEMELATELLEVADEAELDQFLGGLMRRATQATGTFMKSQTGRALGGILRGAAKKALPHLGRAVGSYFGGAKGGDLGAQLASQAGRVFGLELEGLSPEDQEYEVARRYIRFACNAAQRAAGNASGSPQTAARAAAVAAAHHHAPGLVGRVAHYSPIVGVPKQGSPRLSITKQGRWVRRGNQIILLDA